MTGRPDARSRTWPLRRWAIFGLVAGLVVPWPATFFALVSSQGEALLPYLVPSTELLRPLGDVMASWPGLLNMSLVSLLNGLTYAVVAGALGAALAFCRPRGHRHAA